MKLLRVLFEYLFNGRRRFKFVESISYGDKYAGIQLIIVSYDVVYKSIGTFILWPIIERERNIYWKPLKKVIDANTLRREPEKNSKSNSPYTGVWFEVEEEIKEFDIYSIKLLKKININSSLHYYLEELSKESVKFKIVQNE